MVISKCSIAEASTTFGISSNRGICLTFRDEMRSTSDVGKEARNAIRENLGSLFYGVDIGLNCQRVESNSRANFDNKIYDEIDSIVISFSCEHMLLTYSLRTLVCK
jgi:hypothetical protein